MADMTFGIFARGNASKHIDEFGNSVEKAGKKLHTVGGIALTAGGKIRAGVGLVGKGVAGLAVGAAGLAVVAGPKLLDLGIKIEAMGNKSKTVFGSSLPIVAKWADTASAKMGMSTRETVALAAGLGDLLTPMGFTQRQAAGMSTQIADLSGAFAQWSNGTMDTAGAADMLSAAMTGEYDSLKSVGVQIDANLVKELMHKAGKDKLTGAAAKQAEAEVVLAEITRQSGNAISNYEKGNNKLALAKNKVTHAIKDMRDRLVVALTPAMTKAADWIGSRMPGALAKSLAWWDRNKTGIAKFGLVVAQVGLLGVAWTLKLVAGVANFAGQSLHYLALTTRGMLGFVSTMLNAGVKAFGWVPGVGDRLRTARDAVDRFRDRVSSGMETASGKALAFSRSASNAGDKMFGAAQKAAGLRNSLNNLPSSKNIVVRTYFETHGTPSSGSRVLMRQHGGPVRPGHAYIVGERQAELFVPDVPGRVLPGVPGIGRVPAGEHGGGNVYITVNGALDPNAVALQIVKILRQLKRTWPGDLGIA